MRFNDGAGAVGEHGRARHLAREEEVHIACFLSGAGWSVNCVPYAIFAESSPDTARLMNFSLD